MARELFQKPVGWLQRFLFNVERGDIPFPSPVIPITYDFPLEIRAIQAPLTTVVGQASVNIYTADLEHHALFRHLCLTTGGAYLLADVFRLHLNPPGAGGLSNPLTFQNGMAQSFVPFIQTMFNGTPNGNNIGITALDPVYIPPGWTLQGIISSAVAGTAGIYSGIVWERLKSYPLPHT